MFVLKVLMFDVFQMFRRFAKIVQAFVILYLTSNTESPLTVILLPRHTELLTSFIQLLFAMISLSFIQ